MSDEQPTAGGGAQLSYATVAGGAKTTIRTDETGAITSPPGGQNPIAEATPAAAATVVSAARRAPVGAFRPRGTTAVSQSGANPSRASA
jgi:hypothetical protein